MFERVIQNFSFCLEQCFDNDGHNLADILFKTKYIKTSKIVMNKNKILVAQIVFCFIIPLQNCGECFAAFFILFTGIYFTKLHYYAIR